MAPHYESAALDEFSCATRYVLPTPALAATVGGAIKMLPTSLRPSLEGAAGDPTFRIAARPRAGEAKRRRVLYCPSLLFGFRRHAVATIPDAVALDWNLRIAEALVRMPIDLVCKPHPEGALKGKPHPVAAIAATSYQPFEEEIDETDV